MADEISKETLKEEIEILLKDADLSKTSVKKVIQELEKKLKVELRSRKNEIDQIVMDHINSMDSEEERTKEENKVMLSDSDDEKLKITDHKNSMDSEEERTKKKNKVSDSDSDDEKLKGTRGSKSRSKAKAKVSEDEKDSDMDDDSDSDEKPRKTRGSKSRKKPATPKAKAPKRAGAGKGKGTGFTRAYKLSPQLSELMGADEMPRHAVVKRIWAIVKEKQLYDPNNKQFAICDDSLYKVIGKQRFRVFGMMKYLKTHFLLD